MCDALMERFGALGADALYARAGLALLAPIVGLILGVPIVAREIELRTTDLAWSLTLRRSRWLLSRLVPMLALALVGFMILGFSGSTLFTAIKAGRASPELTEVASQGPTLVARGLMAMGIAVLLGAVIGRTMPAFLLAALAVLAWSVVAVPIVQHAMFEQYAVWQSQGDTGWQNGVGPIAFVDYGNFDPSRSGAIGEPGARIDDDQLQQLQLEECGPYPGGAEVSPEVTAWNDCHVRFADQHQWIRVVPVSSYAHFQLMEGILGAANGTAALLLTFGVVARRRSS
ncbi:MAG: hypothetical protein ACRDMH_15985 [Solirubrobacterales bacterium]